MTARLLRLWSNLQQNLTFVANFGVMKLKQILVAFTERERKCRKMSVVIKPSSCFSNGMSYEFFLESFCYRCKKGKINPNGFAEYPENGGCKIWDAMERARYDIELYPCNDVVLIEKNGEVMYWNVCKHFESSDERLMKQYKMLFENEVQE